MDSRAKKTFVCFDLETTGLEPKNDLIIEVALSIFTLEGEIDSFETLIDPGRPIPIESTRIHNICDQDVAGKPKIEDVLPKILALIGNHTIVGHMISTDIAFLQAAAAKQHIVWNPSNAIIDTFRLARLYGESSDNSLQTLRDHLDIPATVAHRAMPDVQVNVAVFKKMVQKPEYQDIDGLIKLLQSPIMLKRMPLGKHKGKFFDDLPLDYLTWMQQWKFDADLTFSIKETRKKLKNNLSS